MAKRRKLKVFLIVILVLVVAFFLYVEVVNRNSKNMTYRQKVLKAIYPAWMWYNRVTGKRSTIKTNDKSAHSNQSLYTLTAQLNSGNTLRFDSFKGKKILIVNTASNCGYTNQYADLEKLYEKYKDKLAIVGFPANDFKHQEKGTDEEIASFCTQNFGITFPLTKKTTVVKNDQQHEVYRWLSDKSRNGWNDQAPTWNFSKYLVNENGELVRYFDPAISPLSDQIVGLIEQ